MSATTAKLTAMDIGIDVIMNAGGHEFHLVQDGRPSVYILACGEKRVAEVSSLDNARAEKLADAMLTHATGHARVQTAANIPEDRAVEGHDPRVRSRLVRLVERAIACQFGN